MEGNGQVVGKVVQFSRTPVLKENLIQIGIVEEIGTETEIVTTTDTEVPPETPNSKKETIECSSSEALPTATLKTI